MLASGAVQDPSVRPGNTETNSLQAALRAPELSNYWILRREGLLGACAYDSGTLRARRLVRTRMKARGFKVATHLFQQRGGLAGERRRLSCQVSIDVEDPEANAFHVKRGHGALERFALGDDRRRGFAAARLQQREQLADPRLCGLAVIESHD